MTADSSSREPHLLTVVRQALGLTQEALAAWLGTTGRRVSAAEAYRRSLPLAALPRLALLASVLPPAESTPPPPAAGPDFTGAAAALRQRQHECAYLATVARGQLAALQASAVAAQARLAALPRLRAAHAAAETGAGPPAVASAWLNVLELEAEEQLRVAGPAAQALLVLRISALDHEAAEAGALAATAEAGPPA